MARQHRTGLSTVCPQPSAQGGHRPHRPGPPPHRGRLRPQRFRQHPTELRLGLALLRGLDVPRQPYLPV